MAIALAPGGDLYVVQNNPEDVLQFNGDTGEFIGSFVLQATQSENRRNSDNLNIGLWSDSASNPKPRTAFYLYIPTYHIFTLPIVPNTWQYDSMILHSAVSHTIEA